MTKSSASKFAVTAIALGLSSSPVVAASFSIPAGDLKSALDAYTQATGASLLYAEDSLRGAKTKGAQGNFSDASALSRILSGTGFTVRTHADGTMTIMRSPSASNDASSLVDVPNLVMAQAAPPRAAVETVTVTSSKLGGADVQSIPIAITALSQEQLTATQTAGGPDLVKQVPNLTFTKTNFTGYSIQIRGIGTQAISVTTDPAVAVAMNDIPFIRNHFFEQEFYDLSQAEVLRGPQGTLYGRNATAGVVNLITAKPTDQFEALASADIGNFKNRRFEGMINLPIVDDRLDLRLAGEWTKRSGYTTNEITGDQVDGRDLWSGRLSLGWKPLENLKAVLVWEHFYEDDDRMRTAKQLCKTDYGAPGVVGVPQASPDEGISPGEGNGVGAAFSISAKNISQGCLPASLYSSESFGVPLGESLPYIIAGWVSGVVRGGNPYSETHQSTDLRSIQTQINPIYKAKNDTVELTADYAITQALTLTSQTGFNQDFLWSTEDYNRFNTAPGIFIPTHGTGRFSTLVSADGVFCDPQLGCSTRVVAQDISSEHAWQFNQEFRLSSGLPGPLNFSVGGNYMHYETEENYFVFANTLTLLAATSGVSGAVCPNGDTPWVPNGTDNLECLRYGVYTPPGHQYHDPNLGPGTPTEVAYYIDPNPLESVNSEGHNYFLSQNPYTLNSYAGFGEVYYNILEDLKLTGGIRWTEDRKHFVDIPSELLVAGYGYPITGIVDQQWDKFTGRFAANWTPKLNFTDQTLVYASFARGYKAGGANPPGAVLGDYSSVAGGNGVPVHPLTFEPEYINAYELGSKNTLLDGALTLNASAFYYDYKGYQISEIVDRTSINLNFDATVRGGELEATYEPTPGLRFKFAGGYENTRLANGSKSVDLIDRTAGTPGWVVFRPFPTEASNCILPTYVVEALVAVYGNYGEGNPAVSSCGLAYNAHLDPVALGTYGASWAGADDPSLDLVHGQPFYTVHNPFTGDVSHGYPISVTNPDTGVPYNYSGFDPLTAPSNGNGFAKDLSGNELPNAPPFTVSFSADYTLPVTPDWAATIHGDYYWQDYSWSRVFNDNPYDRLRGYTNINMALILTSQNGWQVMGYVKNIFNVTDITGAFLNSDDSGLTTNVFLTDPRLFGVRVTKNW